MTLGIDQIIHLQSSIPERNQRVVAPQYDHAYALEAKAFGGKHTPPRFLPGEAQPLLGSGGG